MRNMTRQARVRFDHFVGRLNRRDRYELELHDSERPVSDERRAALKARLIVVTRAIAEDEIALTRLQRALDDLARREQPFEGSWEPLLKIDAPPSPANRRSPGGPLSTMPNARDTR